jgi:hypothetical protein
MADGQAPTQTAEARPAARQPATQRPADRTPVRLAVFGAGLALALIGGFGLGRVVDGPDAGAGAAAPSHGHAPGTTDGGDGHSHSGGSAATSSGGAVSGLAVSDGAFRLEVESTTFTAGRRQPLRFQIMDTQRRPVTNFTVQHDKPLHLIVARRDLTGFQHLHPTMAPDGTWSVPLTLREPGVWRAYADFTGTPAGGQPVAGVLGIDLTVPGSYRPRPLPPPAPRASVDGFEVAYEGRPRVGAIQPLLFRVTRAGQPATLEPYLGAYGHLVTLREGDLGYVHVHPEAQLAGGAVKFWLTAPSPGRYRMFFEFQVAGQVHRAEFTLAVG